MRYSLADHVVTIGLPPDVSNASGLPKTISIGGEGSYLGSISISRNSPLFTTTGDATGSWHHDKNLNKTGKVTLQINQLAPQVAQLISLFKLYEKSSTLTDGLTIVVTEGNDTVASCNDCYVDQVPEMSFGDTASNQSWSLTCGEVMYE